MKEATLCVKPRTGLFLWPSESSVDRSCLFLQAILLSSYSLDNAGKLINQTATSGDKFADPAAPVFEAPLDLGWLLGLALLGSGALTSRYRTTRRPDGHVARGPTSP